jgi:hypothetical protein
VDGRTRDTEWVRRGLHATVVMAAMAALTAACASSPGAARRLPPFSGATATTAAHGASTTTSGPSPPPTNAGAPTPTVTIASWTGREPAAIYFSGDAGDVATALTWSVWGQTEAVGHGMRNELGCVPDCAQGTSTPYPVTITMTDPVDGVFSTIVEQTADGHGTTNTFHAPDLGQGACANADEDSCVFS